MMELNLKIEELTFSQLRVHYKTGRSFVISGTGRDRKYGYRRGCQTDIGDIEESRWQELMRQLIHQSGEDALQAALLSWTNLFCPWLHTKKEREQYALELHAARIFDDPAWVSCEEFNCSYRPPTFDAQGSNRHSSK